ADGGQGPRITRIQEQSRYLFRIRGAAAVAERQQPSPGVEPRGGLLRAGGDVLAAASADLGAQRGRFVRFSDRRRPALREPRRHVRRALVQKRVQRLDRSGVRFRGPGHAGTTAIASLACTRMVSPTPAVTSATLTSSSPASVATIARSSSSSRTTFTATAVSEHVMQTSPWHSGTC